MTLIIMIIIAILVAILFWDESGDLNDPFPDVQSMIKEERFQEAAEKLAEIEKTAAGDVRVAYFQGELAEKQGNFQVAVEKYGEVLDSGSFHPMIERKQLYQKVPDLFAKLEQHDNEYLSLLTLLKVYPKDKIGNEKAVLMTFGAQLFHEALIFCKRLEPNASMECKRAYVAALAESGDIEGALTKVVAYIEHDKDDPILNVLHIALYVTKNPKKGRELAEKAIQNINDEARILQISRIYITMGVQLGIIGPTISFLQNQITREVISDEGRAELLYAMSILALKIEEYNLAEQLHSSLRTIKPNYRRSEDLKLYIDARFVNEQNEKVTPFATIMQELLDNMLPKNLFFRVSGVRNPKEIEIQKYFEKAEGKVQLAGEFRPFSEQELLDQYLAMTKEEFLPFAETSLATIGYKLRKSLDTEKAAFEYIAESRSQKKEKVLTSFFRFKQGAQLSDVFVNNFLSDIKNQSCERGVLILNADLTEAGIGAAQKAENLRIIEKERILELMQSYLFEKQKDS